VFDGKSIWAANTAGNSVTKLRAADGALEGTYDTGQVPNAVCFDGANVWVANQASNTLSKF
jgi:DNA-binding beta-propeller fold protein YncE